MNRTTASLLVSVAFLLTACASGPKSAVQMTIYDFGLPATVIREPVTGSGWSLEVRAPPWFDSLGVDYRLAYDDPLKPREYVSSRWAANPGVLLAQHLQQQFGITSSAVGGAGNCLLHVDLQEFSQVFDSAQSSRAVLQAGVSLINSKRRVIAERRFVIEKSAITQDARGGVAALVQAGTELGRQMAVWLADSRSGTEPGLCRDAQ